MRLRTLLTLGSVLLLLGASLPFNVSVIDDGNPTGPSPDSVSLVDTSDQSLLTPDPVVYFSEYDTTSIAGIAFKWNVPASCESIAMDIYTDEMTQTTVSGLGTCGAGNDGEYKWVSDATSFSDVTTGNSSGHAHSALCNDPSWETGVRFEENTPFCSYGDTGGANCTTDPRISGFDGQAFAYATCYSGVGQTGTSAGASIVYTYLQQTATWVATTTVSGDGGTAPVTGVDVTVAGSGTETGTITDEVDCDDSDGLWWDEAGDQNTNASCVAAVAGTETDCRVTSASASELFTDACDYADSGNYIVTGRTTRGSHTSTDTDGASILASGGTFDPNLLATQTDGQYAVGTDVDSCDTTCDGGYSNVGGFTAIAGNTYECENVSGTVTIGGTNVTLNCLNIDGGKDPSLPGGTKYGICNTVTCGSAYSGLTVTNTSITGTTKSILNSGAGVTIDHVKMEHSVDCIYGSGTIAVNRSYCKLAASDYCPDCSGGGGSHNDQWQSRGGSNHSLTESRFINQTPADGILIQNSPQDGWQITDNYIEGNWAIQLGNCGGSTTCWTNTTITGNSFLTTKYGFLFTNIGAGFSVGNNTFLAGSVCNVKKDPVTQPDLYYCCGDAVSSCVDP